MEKLTDEQFRRLQELLKATENAKDDLDSAVEDFNSAMKAKFEDEVAPAERDFNSAREKLQSYIDELKQEAIEYFDNQPEDWQTSDEGNAYNDWTEKMDNAYNDLDDIIEVEQFTDIEVPETDYSSVENIEQSPE